MSIEQIQQALRERRIDGWLFVDHHSRDPLAYRILGIPAGIATRRWYYFIPFDTEPVGLVHRIESAALDALPGYKHRYSSWAELQSKLKALLSSRKTVAMQYSRDCAIPYVSLVDAGTVEFIRNLGTEIVSSADLIQEFEARWTEEQFQLHLEAGRYVDQIRRDAFSLIGDRLRSSAPVTEYDVQQFILKRFENSNLVTDHGPIVAVNSNASDPHYEPTQARPTAIKSGDLVLIDLWAKRNTALAVYYDVTWTGFCGALIPDKVQRVFDMVRSARVKASQFVIDRTSASKATQGWEVDSVARSYIASQGYAEYFFHRTGHSIGTNVHGNGANMDDWESHDDRQIIPNTCFSIEPGIYLPEFGIRSEVNMYVNRKRALITGEEQHELVKI